MIGHNLQILHYQNLKKNEWKTYRQNLRDLPATESDPENATFPTKPS